MPINNTVLYTLRPVKKVDLMLSDLGTIKKKWGLDTSFVLKETENKFLDERRATIPLGSAIC